MPSSPQSISPPWNEADSFRETTLLVIDDEQDREALRQVGRLLYNLAVETTRLPGEESSTHGEMRAAAAELRFLEGFLGMVGRSAEESDLQPADDALARFAGKLARRVCDVAEAIEHKL
ncbi:MAG TPA: hypothetical protein VHR45_11170 [Thermoanaerobaculia bacterium]|nr:hypothetical protein [Thermoanaerobaculia bacterium]